MKVNIPSKTIRAMAWDSLKGKFWLCLGMSLFANVLTSGLSFVGNILTSNAFILDIISIIELLILGAATLGLTRFFLFAFRGQDVNFDTFTDGFQSLGKAFLMELISTIKTVLWSFLFIIPGIIYALGNSVMYQVMADHPEYTANECIAESQRLMKGNKWKFVKLLLSFFGWGFLASLPSQIYTNLYGPAMPTFSVDITWSSYTDLFEVFTEYGNQISDFNTKPIMILLNVLPVFVSVYMFMANMAFYDLAADHLVVTEE